MKFFLLSILSLITITIDAQDLSKWMQENWDILSSKSLQQIVIPGSHDAGMSYVNNCTSFANTCNTRTQTLPIGEQLQNGFRYFDLRPNFYNPTVGDNEWYLGHYSEIENVLGEGCNGEPLAAVLGEVAGFLKNNPEIVILDFSHYYYTYSSVDIYHNFTVDKLNADITLDHCPFSPCKFNYATGNSSYPGLIQLINQALSPYLYSNINLKQEIAETPLTKLLPDGAQNGIAIVILESPQGYALPTGMYRDDQINIYNNYANSDDLKTMISDQKGKFLARAPLDSLKSPYDPHDMFLLSWTLTQQPGEAVACVGDPLDPLTILYLADIANDVLSDTLNTWHSSGLINPTTIPNIIYTDNNNASIAEVSILLNKQLYEK